MGLGSGYLIEDVQDRKKGRDRKTLYMGVAILSVFFGSREAKREKYFENSYFSFLPKKKKKKKKPNFLACS